MPPSTWITTPVTYEAFSEARKTHTFANSSGVPIRPSGTSWALRATYSSTGIPACLAPPRKRSVMIRPGHTTLIVMLSLPSSGASVLLSPATPGRTALDSSSPSTGCLIETDWIVRTRPHRREQRHFERTVPLLVGHLVEHAARGPSAVRHQHVDPAEGLLRARDDRLHVGGLGDVGRHPEHLGAGLGPHLLGRGLHVTFGARAHGDPRAFGGKAHRAGLAHALARRRDQDALASQPEIHARTISSAVG